MSRAEREGLPYLFRLRTTTNVKRALERAMAEHDWTDAGQGWQGKDTSLRLMGWSRQRRHLAAPQAQSPVGGCRPLASRVATAQLCRSWLPAGGLGIRCFGDLAGQRGSDFGPAVS